MVCRFLFKAAPFKRRTRPSRTSSGLVFALAAGPRAFGAREERGERAEGRGGSPWMLLTCGSGPGPGALHEERPSRPKPAKARIALSFVFRCSHLCWDLQN